MNPTKPMNPIKMTTTTRRQALRDAMKATALLAAIPSWAVPALAEGEADAEFTDYPKTFNPNNPNSITRLLDIRKIDGLITPADQFFAIQHFNQPEVDPVAYRLKFTGMVRKDVQFTLEDLKKMKRLEMAGGSTQKEFDDLKQTLTEGLKENEHLKKKLGK